MPFLGLRRIVTLQPVGNVMDDITTRLRRWTHDANAQPASDLMDEAAAEIDRLRLAAEEREAIWTVAEAYAENDGDQECEKIARVMHGLWQRTK